MRIPLDYYQILGVTIKADAGQLQQAYSDRLLQQPRREYNEQAIVARQELIEYAYQVLSNPQQKADYDAQFFVHMQAVETDLVPSLSETPASEVELTPQNSQPTNLTNPTIDIPASQFVGALLIFHEFGEYELALKLGIDFYNSEEFAQLQQQQEEYPKGATQENIILALALAYLELGREQWHQREYENAALSDQLGLDLLRQKNLFPQVQEELELDLYKLRPYRVLELISQNPLNSAQRDRGFQLLKEMLLQRQGIEGKGEDCSGLSFEQFLCFIQQLRTYLTSWEQQQLFDNDSQNDSAIANYLAVYALLGQGFTLKKPELILRAQRKLDVLADKQDVGWEQAVTALLLGHTEKAIRKLQSSSDSTKLEAVRQHTPENGDLLTGMYLYSEKWLKEDVLAQFIDLLDNPLTLREYFDDLKVQKYLELVPEKANSMTPTSLEVAEKAPPRPQVNQATVKEKLLSSWRSLFSNQKVPTKKAPVRQELVGAGVHPIKINDSGRQVNPPKTKTQSHPQVASNRIQNVPAVESLKLPRPPQPKTKVVASGIKRQARNKTQGVPKKPVAVVRRRKLDKATLIKGWLFILSLIFGVGSIGFIATKLFLSPNNKTASTPQLAIAVAQPTIEIPTVAKKPVEVKPQVTFTDTSKQVIQQWLTSKSAAFGKEHQITQLDSILAEPLLSTWRERALAYQKENLHREYQHQITMRSAKIDPQDSNKATVEAEVREVAQHYQSGKINQTESYDDNLLVRYQLIRKGEQWLIQNTEVIKSL
ncbi:heat shock protein DnaJ domain protein [Chondrocystis sp. NIES-4102]|nr:heat shock protein DnaJ domain protein [Chondrocystis sp. NIES-4102]